MKYNYLLETYRSEKWHVIIHAGTREYCLGYFDHVCQSSPRNAFRIIRGDGKVIDSSPAVTEVNIGMIASYPTVEQYEGAAKHALDMAAAIRTQLSTRDKTISGTPVKSVVTIGATQDAAHLSNSRKEEAKVSAVPPFDKKYCELPATLRVASNNHEN